IGFIMKKKRIAMIPRYAANKRAYAFLGFLKR
ncbi:unnamed protein product, partial [marine sediment metagenome]